MTKPHSASTPLTGLDSLVSSSVSEGDITQVAADTIIVNLFEGVTHPGGATGAVDAALNGAISELIAAGELTGKLGAVAQLHSQGRIPARLVLVAGLGPSSSFSLEAVRRASAAATVRARALGSKKLATITHGSGIGGLDASQAAQATLEGALLASYRFGGWRREAATAPTLELITLVERDPALLSQVEEGALAAHAVALALEQPLQRVAHGLVIIHDVNGAFFWNQAHDVIVCESRETGVVGIGSQNVKRQPVTILSL